MFVLHIMVCDKFMPDYIEMIDSNFNKNEHFFAFITTERYEYGLKKSENIKFFPSNKGIFEVLPKFAFKADKIIIHGLWRKKINQLFYENQILLKKTYWIMWGGDFYFPHQHDELQKFMIQNVAYFITDFSYDVKYIRKNYSARGIWLKFFGYECSYFKDDIKKVDKKTDTIRLLVGNSGDQTNHHIEILNKLSKFKDENIEIYCPLSYSITSKEYLQEVLQIGQSIFKNKFKPLLELIPQKKYYEFLSTIDIAFFNHNRQQAFGNITTLLSLGKKIYIRKGNAVDLYLKDKGIIFYNMCDEISLNLLSDNDIKHNISILKKYLSKSIFLQSWRNFFGNQNNKS